MADEEEAEAGGADALAGPPRELESLGEQAAIARIGRALFGDAAAPAPPRIDRYEIVEPIGRGAFGRVYKAIDPTLGRSIAIKVLAEGRQEGARARLIREAKIMATVGHPNIAAVHDAGTVGEGAHAQVFIAMELVTGRSLRTFLEERPASAEVLPVMLQAGRGLEAAHTAGIVHGDFKPENVLLGDDGRVRVVDFGLARPLEDEPPGTSPAAASAALSPTTVTATGALVGTPAYMAPEQLRGGAADVRADQFAFAIVLWEALCGERPYPGETVAALAEAVHAGRRRPFPRGRGSARQRRLLETALATEPARRFPSMSALLRELERGAARRTRGPLVAALGVLGALGVVGGGLWRGREAPRCDDGAASLAGVWDGAVRAELEQRGAAPSATTVRALDGYAERWRLARREACEATHVRHEQSEELLDRRTACLRERRAALAAVVTALRADPAAAARAPSLLQALPPLAPCADTETLAAVVRIPDDPRQRAGIAALEEQLDRVRELHILGKVDEALALAQKVEAQADELGFAPLSASAKIWIAETQASLGRAEPSRAAARAGFDAALKGSDRRAALWAASILAFGGATDARERDEALRWVATARSLLPQAPDPQFVAKIDNAEGNIYLTAGDHARARPAFERVIAAFRELDPEHPNLGSSIAMLGIIDLNLGDARRAKEELVEALARIERGLGETHPEAASARINLALAQLASGEYADAEAGLRRALAQQRATLGPDTPYAAYGQLALAQAEALRGRFSEAAADIAEAERVALPAFGAAHPLLGEIAMMRAEIAARAGASDAVPLARRALELLRGMLGDGNLSVATAEVTLAHALRTTGRAVEALAPAQQAMTHAQAGLPAEHPQLALPSRELGAALRAVGRAAEAVAVLTRAEALLVARPADPLLLAEVRFELARALAARGGVGDLQAAASAAERAVAEFPAEADPSLRAEIKRWAKRRR